jgi:tetratricopeptide repeat protein 21B
MSAGRELKPSVYYLVRRGWYEQTLRLCDSTIQKKGKDPVAVYWKAFALGMMGNISECKRQLDSFAQRRDMQLPVTMALLYFNRRTSNPDREVIDALSSELNVAEDVTKEAGLVLAARFALFTNDYTTAVRVSQKLLSSCRGSPSTAFELEGQCVEQWCVIEEAVASLELGNSLSPEQQRQLQSIDASYRGKTEQAEVDGLMIYIKSRLIQRNSGDALALLNQCIAMHAWFTPALSEKASILASASEWEQALDAAQRALDAEADNFDALRVIAMHSFLQESQPAEAFSKLEDVDNALRNKEPSACATVLETAQLFSALCARQSKPLMCCFKMCERSLKHSPSVQMDALLLCQMGQINIMQGVTQYENAMKNFKEASKRDANCVGALEGMVLSQLMEGLYEDAEGQIELLSVMHSQEDLSPEFRYLQAMLAKYRLKGSGGLGSPHLQALDECREFFFRRASSLPPFLFPFRDLVHLSPDFLMRLAVDYLLYLDSPGPPPLFLRMAGGGLPGSSASDSEAQGAADESYGSGSDNSGSGSGSSGGGGGDSGLGADASPAVKIGMELLVKVLRIAPGMTCAYIEQARCFSAQGMFDEAVRALHTCLSLWPHCSAALVAMAALESRRQNTAAANRALEQALSCDFSIRGSTLFRLVQVTVRAQQGRLDEALVEMEELMGLPEIRSSNPLDAVGLSDGGMSSNGGGMGGKGTHADTLRLTDDDRVGAFVTHAALLGRIRRLKEANKVLSEAKVVFSGGKQEVLLLVASSQLAVERSDFDSAIRMLDKVSEESPIFTRAQIIKADIFLQHNRDKEGYTQCYQRLVNNDASAKNFALLGEAYLRILHPEAAVEALEQAYKLDPSNARLRGRIGRALVSTHEYHRAVDFYEAAIRDVAKSSSHGQASSEAVLLSRDLAKLYVKLGRVDSALRTLSRALSDDDDAKDLTALQQEVQTLLLIAEVNLTGSLESNKKQQQQQQQKQSGPSSSSSPGKASANAVAAALSALERAKEAQSRVVQQIRSAPHSVNSAVDRERGLMGDVCVQIGRVLVSDGDERRAEKVLEEALQHNPQNLSAMVELARLHRGKGELDHCKQQCRKVLLADPKNSDAAIMLSDVTLHASDETEREGAAAPLEALLKLRPNDYRALERLVGQFRRSGTLDRVADFFKAAAAADGRAESNAGYRFCQGLYARFVNDIGKAIAEFNQARRDDEWAEEALMNMIELYLNPNQDGVWDERDQGPLDESTAENIAAADTLLRELQPLARDKKRVKVLENYCLLATRSKTNIEKAMTSFGAMLDAEQDYLPAVLGMATGFMVDNNKHKAQNLLKRVSKFEVGTGKHDSNDFTRANLLLAKFYVEKSKFDVAQDICRRTLQENKSCSQAWDVLGLVYEKESDYEKLVPPLSLYSLPLANPFLTNSPTTTHDNPGPPRAMKRHGS